MAVDLLLDCRTELVQFADETTESRFNWIWNIEKGVGIMVDIEKIEQDILQLELLTAEEYCRPQVEMLYAEFEESRANQIKDLRTSLEIFKKYQVVEETAEEVGEE